MASIVVSTYMARYPLGGMLWWALQWPLGFRAAGHDVFIVEKAEYADACFDPTRGVMSDDCAYGVATVRALLAPHGLADSYCFVDASRRYHGVPRGAVERVIRSADALIDVGNHGAWLPEAADGPMRVLIEGEPGYTQMKMAAMRDSGGARAGYDRYYSCGANIGTAASSAPNGGVEWGHVFNPVMCDLLSDVPPAPAAARVTTVMNWQSHDRIEFAGVRYGQKDVQFEKFMDLPRRVDADLEVAVAGNRVPTSRLLAHGWRIADGHAVTRSVQSYLDYIAASCAEFSVCKHVFVATRSGWFSDRSAAYLASGRPVVIEDTGLAPHLPSGHGLFAVDSAEAATEALERIAAEYPRHRVSARAIAREYLDAPKVLGRMAQELGL